MILPGSDPRTTASFSLANRAARAAWGLAWLVLFRPSPRPAHTWRAWLLRRFGARVGSGTRIHPGVVIWAPWQLTLGDRVLVGHGANLYNMAPIFLGNDCIVSQGAHLCGGSHDIDTPNLQLVARPIVLANDVWVCAEAFVGLGVHVSSGCVIGARAVVTRSIEEPWTVWAGNPAVKRRMRRPKDMPR